MTVYRDTDAEAYFDHPHPGPLKAEVYRKGLLIKTFDSVSPVTVPGGAPNRYKIPLTYVETQFDGQLNINWTAPGFARTSSVKVVTPLVSVTQLRPIFKDTNWTDEELKDLENKVRVAIESHTRQTFGYYIGQETVYGSGEKKVCLPRRLIKLNSVNTVVPGYFVVSGDGWSMSIQNKNLLTIKEAPPEEFMTYVTHGVITVPDSYWKQFRTGSSYTIDGEWGYYEVPEDVQEAALLLANDFACGDSIYRDRFIEMIKSADWNFSFAPGAYEGMGNVRVDQLLAPYRREGMIII